MTVDPILESEESSFECEDQTFALPQGKHITLNDSKETPLLLTGLLPSDRDPFVSDPHASLLDFNMSGVPTTDYGLKLF